MMTDSKVPPLTMVEPVRSIIVDDMNIASVLSNKEVIISLDHEVDKDEALILALGYKQEFKREFTLWSVFAVSFSVLGLLPSIAATFSYQQLVVGISPLPWLIGLVFVTSVAYSLAEIASAFPTAGGTPYAVSQLAPKKYAPLLTWLTCFSNWLGQITAPPLVNYSGACMMLALYSYNSTDFTPTNWQIYLLTLGIQVVHAIISCFPTKWLSWFNSAGTVANMLFLVIVFLMIFIANDREQISDVTKKFNDNGEAWGLYNQTEFPTGIAFLVSFLGVIWSMSGYDSPFHLSEECSNANVAAPKAIVLTATFGGVVGFFFMIAISYTVVNIDLIAEDPQGLGQPFVSFLTQIMQRRLVIAATAFTIVSSFFMGESCMLAASRVTYAYARDNLFPYSKYWKHVNTVTKTPVNAVWINWFLGQLLLLLIFAGDVAVGAIFSVGCIAAFISFTIPTLLKITYSRDTFIPGPWNLGRLSTPIGAVSVAFVTLMIPILCFPTTKGKDLTPNEMNWTVVVYFGPMLMALIWFLVDAHKWYEGPRSNLDDSEVNFVKYNTIDGIVSRDIEKEDFKK